MKVTKNILLLAANPKNTTRLRIDEEVREIKNGLLLSKNRDQFNIVQEWAVRPKDIRRALLNYSPQYVHFSGHGDVSGIILENESGEASIVEPEALSGLFEVFSDDVVCVILNSCYSERQADAINRHIPYVVGMKKEIGDEAAIAFTVGFYDAIAAGKSVEKAFKLGCNAIQLKNIPEHLTPIIKIKSDFLPTKKVKPVIKDELKKSSVGTGKAQRFSKEKFGDKKLRRISIILGIILAFLSIIKLSTDLFERNSNKLTIAIKGQIRDKYTNQGIKGALITIDGEDFRTTTNADGEFLENLKNIPMGEKIRIRASHNKYKTKFKDRIINSSVVIEIDFYLESVVK